MCHTNLIRLENALGNQDLPMAFPQALQREARELSNTRGNVDAFFQRQNTCQRRGRGGGTAAWEDPWPAGKLFQQTGSEAKRVPEHIRITMHAGL